MRWLCALVLSATVAGCPSPPMPPPLLDTGPRDAPGMDVPGLDADLDAPPEGDVPGLDAPGPDDAGAPDDVPDVGPVDAPDDAPKDTGAMDVELPDGAFVTCLDSRMCRGGFACESGTCVDRRVHCGPIGDCPYGFFCESSGAEPYFCQRLLRPCTSSAECPTGTCGDLDGDGDSECVAPGACDARADCAAGTTCESLPIEVFSECGSYGACTSAADCGGRECVDLWGDGVRECVDAGGCRSTASCPANGICATPPGGGPPTCLSRPLP